MDRAENKVKEQKKEDIWPSNGTGPVQGRGFKRQVKLLRIQSRPP